MYSWIYKFSVNFCSSDFFNAVSFHIFNSHSKSLYSSKHYLFDISNKNVTLWSKKQKREARIDMKNDIKDCKCFWVYWHTLSIYSVAAKCTKNSFVILKNHYFCVYYIYLQETRQWYFISFKQWNSFATIYLHIYHYFYWKLYHYWC